MAMFELAELIDVAVRDERTGVALYEALAASARAEQVRDFFLAAARQEEFHAACFEKMLRDVGRHKSSEIYDGEYDRYLAALVEGRAFPAADEAAGMARATKSDAQAIALAVSLEKDTLLFLEAMKAMLARPSHKYVDEIIREERDHLAELGQLRRSLVAPGDAARKGAEGPR